VSDGVPVGWARTTPGGKPGARRAAVILLRGAGDATAEESIVRDVSARLVKRGYVVEVLRYFDRTHTTVDGGAWLRTIGDAVNQLDQAPGVDSARIGLHCAQANHRVKAVVDYFGVYRVKDPANVAKLPPVLLMQGESEAQRVDAMLTKYNVPHETDIYSGQPDSRQTADHVADFLARYLPAN
jgi:dienelactone hydrolase